MANGRAGSITDRGLSENEARLRLARHGPNALPQPAKEPGWRRFLRQFESPLIYILVFALVVDAGAWLLQQAHGVPAESLAIAAILILNAALGVWQERKAENALAQLEQLAAPHVWVLRDGKLVRLNGSEIVPGDLVRLEAGDRVPADGTAHVSENLAVDESVLTGESVPVGKEAGADLHAGTVAVRGKTYFEVTRTGSESAMGRLAAMLGEVEKEMTPLERRLRHFGNLVARWVFGLAAVIAIAGVAIEGMDRFGQVFIFAVALAVAAVPEGLPAILTLTLALGVERMARRKAVVRKLAAVEALGSVTVIATDKTGTITENRMEVRRVDSPDADRALKALVLANDAEPDTGAGDPLELALLRHATDAGLDPIEVRAAVPRRSSRSFDSTAKFMRFTGDEDGKTVSYLKGAPEVLMGRCSLPAEEERDWTVKLERYANDGFRLLGVACGDGEREDGLTWLGLVLLWDPPRPEVPDAVRRAREAGVRIIMVTGDHQATAANVAQAVGIEAGKVVTGAELDAGSPEDFQKAVQEAGVFARVSPEHKLEIVRRLKQEGEVVAMTGDGVNDAPALKNADVGVAMGQRGSDVTREVADLVLLDDNFATIVAAIEEGRSIYENIQKFIRFLFSTNLSEVLVVTVGAFAAFLIGLRDAAGNLLLPLTAAQLLWINLVTDGAPAVALGVDRNPDVMSRVPRSPTAPLLDRGSLQFIVLSGTVKAIVALAILWLVPRLLGQSLEATRTANFLFMAAGQLLFAYPARRTDLVPRPNQLLHLAVAVAFAVQLLVILVPGLMQSFDVVPLSLAVWAWVGVSILVSWGGAEVLSRAIWSGRRVVRRG